MPYKILKHLTQIHTDYDVDPCEKNTHVRLEKANLSIYFPLRTFPGPHSVLVGIDGLDVSTKTLPR